MRMDDQPDQPPPDSRNSAEEAAPSDMPQEEVRLPSGPKRVVYAALIGNSLIMVMKFMAASVSGSSAMLAEAVHSVADTVNQALLLLGFSLSKKPPDEKHPFGYGMERYFWAFVVAISIFIIGATFSVYEGVNKIRHPAPLVSIKLSYLVLGLAFIFELIAWLLAAREFWRHGRGRGILQTLEDARDPAVLTVLFEDTAALSGIVIAAGGITLAAYTGNSIYDGIASILIGVMLSFVAFFLAMENRDLLLGESASRRDRAVIREILRAFPEVERVLELLTMHIGPDEILLNANIEFRDGMTTQQIEKLVDDIEAAIRKEIPQTKKIFIEADTPPEIRTTSPGRSNGS